MYVRRRRVYFWMMGVCLALFVGAWAVVRLFSVPAAVAMCVVAMVIPPVAAMVANRRGPEDRWWDDPTGDKQSDEWWDELDGRTRPGRGEGGDQGRGRDRDPGEDREE